MKILILSIYHESTEYRKMLQIQQKYCNTHPDIDFFFVTLNPKLNKQVELIHDVIYVKGYESHVNILFKTIKALEYVTCVLNRNYDFVVRTNVSTLIVYRNLVKYLTRIPRKNIYVGGKLETLRWNIAPYELIESKQHLQDAFYGFKFFQGIAIIFSFDVVLTLLDISKTIEYDMVDDLKIGLLMQQFIPEAYNNINKLPNAKVSLNQIHVNSVFVRNKTNNRNSDILRMNLFVKQLVNK